MSDQKQGQSFHRCVFEHFYVKNALHERKFITTAIKAKFTAVVS